MTNYACHKHNLHCFAVHYLTKASSEISASFLKDFLSKGKKVQKTHKLCIIYASLCIPRTPFPLIHVKFQPDHLIVFRAKMEQVKKHINCT